MRSLLLVAGLAFATPALADCGGPDMPCEMEAGSYYVLMPEDATGPVPAMVWLHGAGGSGAGIARNTGMSQRWLDAGWAVIGANGMPRPGSTGGGSWNFFDRENRRDDDAFVLALADDAAARFAIDRDQMVLAGFSIGGSMTSYIACREPAAFMAYAPVAGGFWRPHPTDCVGPVRLFHTHGWTDQTVPLEGRPLRNGAIYQGDIFQTMAQWRSVNGCDGLRADEFITEGEFWRRRWTTCDAGTALEFALFPGGHGIPPGWSEMVIDWLDALPR